VASLNILMVTADFFPDTFGGVDRCVFELSKGLAARGHNVTVVARRVRRELPAHEEMSGFNVFRFSMLPYPLPVFHITEILGAWRTARRVLRQRPIDLVHVHEALPGSFASGTAHHRGIPIVYTLHAPWSSEWSRAFVCRRPAFGTPMLNLVPRVFARYLRGIERKNLRRSSRVVALSRFTRDILMSDYEVPPERIVLIPGGVDTERFKPHGDRREVRRSLGIDEAALVLLTVRRLVPRMGIENLLRAAALLKQTVPDLKLLIGGRGELRTRLEKVAMSEGLGDSVSFLGAISDSELPSYYQAADLFVLPTLELEAFGLVTLEALACGTPVVGTSAGAIPEILSPLDFRLVADDVTAESIAQAVRGVIEQQLLAPALRQRCRAYVEQNYSWRSHVELHEKLYAECLARKGQV
jgi:glycosyltransferase involved in cell wall biosynthesis